MKRDEDVFYQSQEREMAATINAPEAVSWMDDQTDTVGNRRAQNLLSVFSPILKNYAGTDWLTVGDGRFGSDANFLEKNGVRATATDIQDELLKVGFEKNFIKRYSKQNAERLTYEDNSFDFVFCKEAYHHFPRPAIAVYEMLRVARTGIVLHEPKDILIYDKPMQAFSEKWKRTIRGMLGKRQTGNDYEVSGNYVYSLSEREIEKMALGLNYRFVAFHIIQDHYIKGIEFVPAVPASAIGRKLNSVIRLKEFLYKIGLYNGGMLTAMLLKQKPSDKVIDDLKAFGYKVKVLSANPYL